MELSVNGLKQLTNRVALMIRHFQFGTKAQLSFLEDLYMLINDGIPANRAIEMMSEVSQGINREVAASLSKKIAEGQPLADGMREWFAFNVVEIIRVGEAGGALGQTLKSAINMLSQQGVAIGSFVAALSYPTLIIVMACIIISYLNGSVFVQFKQIKPVAEWPAAGQQFVALAEIIKHWWWSFLLAVVLVMVVMRRLMTHYVGELRPALDKIPPFSFYRRFVAARVLETLGLLVANGVVFKSAIRVMQHQANPYMGYHLAMMEHLLSMGKTNIADVLATGLVAEDDLMRLRVMAEVKGFEHGLIRMGVRGTEEATRTLQFLSKIAGGALTALGAYLILMIVRGIYITGTAMGN